MRSPCLLLCALCAACAPAVEPPRLAAGSVSLASITPSLPAASAPPAQVAAAEPKPCPSLPVAGMACVPGGPQQRGSDDGPADERPRAEVWIETFLMDLHEVTNTDYAACVRAGDCQRTVRYPGYMGPNQPIVGVRWDDAVAFCRRAGKRLPTEAEFERAAAGPTGDRFPWGNNPEPCTRTHVETAQGKGCGTGFTRDVATLPAGRYGIFDLSGNVHEWVQDFYAPCYEGCARACGAACTGRNPRGPCNGAARCNGYVLRGVRGGSWWWPMRDATAQARRGMPPSNQAHHRFGFRCARDVELP